MIIKYVSVFICVQGSAFVPIGKSCLLIQLGYDPASTVCFNDFDKGSDMFIFESILTTFCKCHFLEADTAVAKIGSSFKFNLHYKQI
jgi:hypothetical protein